MSKIYDIVKGTIPINEFFGNFSTDEEATKYILNYIFPGGKLVCPYCGCSEFIYLWNNPKTRFNCGHCRKTTSFFNGTIFEGLKQNSQNWLYIIYSSFVSRKSIPSTQLTRESGLSYYTVLNFRRRMQLAMANYDLEPFCGVVEMDEVYLGGSNHGRVCKTSVSKGIKTYPVFGIYNKDTHRVYSYPALSNDKGQYLTGKQILNFITKTCRKGSLIVSDEWKGYNILDKQDSEYYHEKVNHSERKYINEKGYTTNGIESYWSIVKKTYYSTHGFFKKEWAPLYLAEADFRYNHLSWESALKDLLVQSVIIPRIIDIRDMGKFGNRVYDIKDYRLVLPKCFDDIDISDIKAKDILLCPEPVYGILRKPYISRYEQKISKEQNIFEYFAQGFGYKDYRMNIVNTIKDLEFLLQDMTKYKDVNYTKEPIIRKKIVCNDITRAKSRKRTMIRRYKRLPKMVQTQIKEEYPNILGLNTKEESLKIHGRIHSLLHTYNKYIRT